MNHCENHNEQRSDIYCRDCKRAICSMCCVTFHQTHACVVFSVLIKDIENNLEKLFQSLKSEIYTSKHNEQISFKELEIYRKTVTGTDDSTENKTIFVDLQTAEEVVKVSCGETRTKLNVLMTSVKKLQASLLSDDVRIDIDAVTQQMSSMTDEKLAGFRWLRCVDSDSGVPIRRTRKNVGEEEFEVNVTQVKCEKVTVTSSRETSIKESQVLLTADQMVCVVGMVIYEGYMVVIHGNNNKIFVYNDAGQLIQKQAATSIKKPVHMSLALYNTAHFLIISDYKETLHLVAIRKETNKKELMLKLVKTTGLDYKPAGLYVHNDGQMMVCDLTSNKLVKYNSEGVCEGHVNVTIRPDCLSSDPVGHGYVASDYTQKQVVWMDENGSVSRVLQHEVTPSICLENPRDLLNDNQGHVLLADFGGHQVLVFNQYAQCIGQLLSEKDGIHHPGRLLLDTKKDTLYVACVKDKVHIVTYKYSPLLAACDLEWPRDLTMLTLKFISQDKG